MLRLAVEPVQNAAQTLGPPDLSGSPGSSVFDLPIGEQSSWNPRPDQLLRTPALNMSGAALKDDLDDMSFVVISGGTGGNSIVGTFTKSDVVYVLPVSDNGGSSSEVSNIIDASGPSVGDLRSRLIRLIPSSPASSSTQTATEAIRALLSHRFSLERSEHGAREEWREIVEGRSELWRGIPPDRKETIRGFLVYFEAELLRHAHKSFVFRNGSVGNFLLASMQLFLRSLPSAIFLFGSITGAQTNARILPTIVTNHTVTISAELMNGDAIIGQCDISHPIRSSRHRVNRSNSTRSAVFDDDDGLDELDRVTSPGMLRAEEEGREDHRLAAPINRLLYLNSYGQEIFPSPNPEFIESLSEKRTLIYSCGSLWTSIIPCLALRGVATAVATSPSLEAKILLLNAKNDRETHGYKASDYIRAIVRSLNRADLGGQRSKPLHPPRRRETQSSYPVSAYVTHVFYLEEGEVVVDIPDVTVRGL
ncbi:UPF0052-domain-containing protein [Dacryopinax primogenitus]|uniref:UPF0052-domain-containing protein n=1 Tax=Dacryopinax primogenitus (strain DJM 731) TaxID=1858805 RepID=M5GCI5_DACPD|nr:UPF0052-domain-containing protein [Dacryopinax primogenitus]EJU01793.1 UPF0052-domain-containing protein [Dacryopinax primogenitus]